MAGTSGSVILYDIPCKGKCQCWSANVWKTRLALNYKGLSYQTQWLPFGQLRETVKSFGVPPNPEPAWAAYSVPCVRFPDGSYVMESANIARQLEQFQPEPSLHLDDQLEKQVGEAVGLIIRGLVPYFMPLLPRSILLPEDAEWFRQDRAARFGMPLEKLEAEKGGEAAWESARPGFEAAKKLLTEHKEDQGPFIKGSVVTYYDFYFVAVIHMFKVFGDESYERLCKEAGPEWVALYEASKPWVERVD